MEGPYVQSPVSISSARIKDAPIAFLDRDGVLNRGKPGYVNAPEEVVVLPGAASVVGDLNRAGYLVCVVTNQSPIQRGLWGPENLALIHRELQVLLLEADSDACIHLFITCPHVHEERCACRKPSPGMLTLGHKLLRGKGTLERSWTARPHRIERPVVDWWGSKPSPPHPGDLMVGDRRSDMAAGWAYGARLHRVPADKGLIHIANRWSQTGGDEAYNP